MKNRVPEIWRIEVVVPREELVELFEPALETLAETVTWFMEDESKEAHETPWVLRGYRRDAVDRAGLEAALSLAAAAVGIDTPEARIEKVPDLDWIAETLRAFPPIAAGRYFIHGSHFEERVPAGRIGLLVDAGTAFGSGEHATTYGCLMALDRLAKRRRFMRPLDVGCGSGILAIAAAKTFAVPALAADIDPRAVAVARENARLNGVAARVSTAVSDGYASRAVAAGKPFDLIFANILARPLVSMAPQLARHLAPEGVAVLSGLLTRHERLVLAAHRVHGLVLLDRIKINGWSTLVIGRPQR